jgi:hypothetical protein
MVDRHASFAARRRIGGLPQQVHEMPPRHLSGYPPQRKLVMNTIVQQVTDTVRAACRSAAQLMFAHREEIIVVLGGMMVIYAIIEFKRLWTEIHQHGAAHDKKWEMIRFKLMLGLLPTPILYHLMMLFFETVRMPAAV